MNTSSSFSSFSSIPCVYYSDLFPDLTNRPIVIVSFFLFYSFILVCGSIGNGLVVLLTLTNQSLQTIQNIFILNLAISDLAVCFVSLPLTPITNIYKNWYFGKVMCHLLPLVQGVSVFICTFSLSAIALDRYFLIVHPHRRAFTRCCSLCLTVLVWVLSIIGTLPYAVFMDVARHPGVCGEFCTEQWPKPFARHAYTVFVLTIQFVLPFIIMIFCYTTILIRLSRRTREQLERLNERTVLLTISEQLKSQVQQRQLLVARTRRCTLILVSMVGIFGLTWLPHNVVSVLMEFNETAFQVSDGPSLLYFVNLITHSAAMINNVTNPILYAWLNPTFMQLLKDGILRIRKPISTLFRQQ